MAGRRYSRVLACASLLRFAALSRRRQPKQIDRIVVFGDSMPTTGNALRSRESIRSRPRSIRPGVLRRFELCRYAEQHPPGPAVIIRDRRCAHQHGNQSAGLPGLTFEVQEFPFRRGHARFPAVKHDALTAATSWRCRSAGNDARFYQQSSARLPALQPPRRRP